MADKTERSIDKVNDTDDPSPGELADPPFIRYLFTPSPKNSCFVLVGDQCDVISVEKRYLMAHSKPLRFILQDSALADGELVRIPDIQPVTFKNFLRFVYGNNILSTLNMEEAVNLMYVAEKYMVEELKPKLSTHICSMLSDENVWIPLQRPECFQQKLLKDAINQNIQDCTDVLLQQQDFLDINISGLLNILQQNSLAVSEIELWRGVLKWAKHNANSEDCATLRELLSEPLKHIRLCTLTFEDFYKEVVPTKLLSDSEVLMVIKSISNNIVLDNLTSVCNTIEPRNLCVKELVKEIMAVSPKHCSSSVKGTSFSIFTNHSPITVVSALFECTEHSVLGKTQNLQFQCECNVSVSCIDYTSNDDSTKPVFQFDFKQNVEYGKEFQIPLLVDGKDIKLSRYSKYVFSFKFKNFKYNSIKCFYNDEFSFDKNLLRSISSEKTPPCENNSSHANFYNNGFLFRDDLLRSSEEIYPCENYSHHSNCGGVKKIVYKSLK